ncbi:MAG: type II toxin-antitoxin system HicB family antitoxin [Zoogloeaceae bacterium]|jgi:antitoxin HicB|nr:type II toxin-antitoxin system HicB family antitoxin [Zoogloeaceae bacterium]
MFYPLNVFEEEAGFWAECPDIPEMKTAGDTLDDLLREAVDGLESALEFYFEARRPIPAPSRPERGQHTVALPTLIVSKVLLHNEMLAQGVKKAELARRLNIAPPNVERIFRVKHKTRIETVEAALNCLGKHLDLQLAA